MQYLEVQALRVLTATGGSHLITTLLHLIVHTSSPSPVATAAPTLPSQYNPLPINGASPTLPGCLNFHLHCKKYGIMPLVYCTTRQQQ